MRIEQPVLYLFVWAEFSPDWSDGLAFAIAENEDEAKRMVEIEWPGVYNWGILTMYPLTQKIAKAVHGGG